MQTTAVTIAVVAAAASVLGEHYILDTNHVAKVSLAEDVHLLSDMLAIFNETGKLHEALKKLIKTMKSEGETIRDDVEKFMQHPLNQLRFMNRYAEQWVELKALLKKILNNKNRLNRLKPKHNLQHEENIGQNFLLDLVDVYGLDVRNFSRDLTPDDCIAIGQKSYESGKYSLCAAWMKQALRKITQDEKAAYTVDAVSKAVATCSKLREKPETASTELYKKLCRREYTQSNEGQADLRCEQTYSPEAGQRYEPTKLEILSRDPDITLYHSLIPRSDIKRMRDKMAAAPRLNNYELYFSHNPGDDNGQLVNRTKVRIAGVENILIENVLSLEVWQNQRRFRSFFSGSQPFIPTNNDFNFLLFLSDVEQGGAAVFEAPAVNVLPKGGDALVWQKGLKMAACPVLTGDRWTAKLKAKPVQRQTFERLSPKVWSIKPEYLIWNNELVWDDLLDWNDELDQDDELDRDDDLDQGDIGSINHWVHDHGNRDF